MNIGINERIAEIAFNTERSIEQREKLSGFWQIIEYLIQRAREARAMADSWRAFDVGCSLLAFKAHPVRVGDRYRIFNGTNVKPEEDDGVDMHAEGIALEAARMAQYDEVIGMVIVGEPEPHEDASPTLRPCKKCRQFFTRSSLVINDTIIFTITHSEYEPEAFEIFTCKELLELYQT